MQRLFTSFAHGAPGAGLLLMRVAIGASFLLQLAGTLPSGFRAMPATYSFVTVVLALLLLVGLWTPVTAVSAALAAGWHAWAYAQDPGFDVLLGVLGLALALLGPGAWSIDARLFGWKRLELQNGTTPDSSPDSKPDTTR